MISLSNNQYNLLRLLSEGVPLEELALIYNQNTVNSFIGRGYVYVSYTKQLASLTKEGKQALRIFEYSVITKEKPGEPGKKISQLLKSHHIVLSSSR
jgi:hypothetical protein